MNFESRRRQPARHCGTTQYHTSKPPCALSAGTVVRVNKLTPLFCRKIFPHVFPWHYECLMSQSRLADHQEPGQCGRLNNGWSDDGKAPAQLALNEKMSAGNSSNINTRIMKMVLIIFFMNVYVSIGIYIRTTDCNHDAHVFIYQWLYVKIHKFHHFHNPYPLNY